MPEFASLPLTQPWFLLVIAGTMAAGIVRGLSGFGSALIVIPILSIFFGPAIGVPVLTLLDVVLTVPLLPSAFRRCRWREVLPLAIAAAVSVPLGTQILILVDGNLLRRAIALIIIAFVVVMASGWRYHGKSGPLLNLGVGACAGAMSGAIGISGPPVILFWLGGPSDMSTVRANVIAFFGLLEVATIASYWLNHLFTGEVLALTLVLAPAYAIALWLGARAFRLVSERLFRIVSLGLIALIALLSLLA